MKKIISLICMVLILPSFFGCEVNNGNSNKATPVPQSLEIKDYFPIKVNTRYVYEGTGNEYASFNIFNDYTSDTKVQQRVDNGGTIMAKVVELKDGKLTRLFSRGEAYYRENLLENKGDEDEILLMEPLAKGNTWTLKDSRIRTITGISVDVTTPLAKYNAIEITTESQKDKTIDYYAKNVGLVKSVFISGGNEITSSLSKIEENVSFTQKINFYYPNPNNDKLNSTSKDISFKTNDITRKVLEVAYKEIVNNNNSKVFTTNTKINSLYLNKDNMVYIDLNSAFSTELNAGALYEGLILQSIANTFGHYYNSQRVVLTIDNNLYQSGHIAMEKGQFIKVN